MGMAMKLLNIFEQMCQEGVEPDHFCFLFYQPVATQVRLMKACAVYGSMSEIHMISAKLEHYDSMVDLFGACWPFTGGRK
ncbi:unnamed protein product, partial [Sphagnum balticum]